jgi:hypothetical protein
MDRSLYIGQLRLFGLDKVCHFFRPSSSSPTGSSASTISG